MNSFMQPLGQIIEWTFGHQRTIAALLIVACAASAATYIELRGWHAFLIAIDLAPEGGDEDASKQANAEPHRGIAPTWAASVSPAKRAR